jgi:hypothetical protein
VRALVFVTMALSLAACATTPGDLYGRPGPSYPQVEGVDPNAPPRIIAGAAPSQCVPFARSASGVNLYGDANTWWAQAEGKYPRSNTPAVGSVFVMRGYDDPSRGHVAVVSAVVSSRIIRVDQANWLNQGEISLSVPVVDVSPNNNWTEVRVWYIPDNHWGGRTYAAEGFIHPFPLVPTS